jgi:hypothetical protein
MADAWSYWLVGADLDIYIRRGPAGCDILTDGRWKRVDPAKYGAPDPWAGKIGNGEGRQVTLAEVPVRGARA